MKNQLTTKLPKKLTIRRKNGEYLLIDFCDVIKIQLKNGIMHVTVRNENELCTLDGSLKKFEASTRHLGIFIRIHQQILINIEDVKSYMKEDMRLTLSNNITASFSNDGLAKFLKVFPVLSFR